MSIKISLPENFDMKPKITVFGVGGAGGNAVNNMIASNLEGVEFWVANTDAQAMDNALTANRLQLGAKTTLGLGAGSHPEVGKQAAEESIDEIRGLVENTNMLFITAGMGGGTGTGAAPVIARAAKEQGALTVGVVTKPFHFEGARRMKVAELGLEELNKYVDTLIVIPNQNLFLIANQDTTFSKAFKMADEVLHSGVRGITDLMTMPGLINLDFADIRAVISEMGKAMMGTGEAEGENRAVAAAEAAITNPLLDHPSVRGAKAVLINITGGSDMTLFQVDTAANRIREEVDPNANIIFGSAFNPDLEGKMRVSVVATGIEGRAAVGNMNVRGATVGEVSDSTASSMSAHSIRQQEIFSTTAFEQASNDTDDDGNEDGGAHADDDAFISPRPAEISTYGMFPARSEVNFTPSDEVADNVNSRTEDDVVTVQRKSKEDVLDIPAFWRRKIQGK